MKACKDRGVVLGVAVVLAAGALIGMVGPAEVLSSRYSDREYALDALALEYLGDYVEDPLLRSRIARPYWCWTPVLTERDHIPKVLLTEAALRHRAQGMAERAGVGASPRGHAAPTSL